MRGAADGEEFQQCPEEVWPRLRQGTRAVYTQRESLVVEMLLERLRFALPSSMTPLALLSASRPLWWIEGGGGGGAPPPPPPSIRFLCD